MLDLSGRLIVIIGGGSVAARKASGVLAAGAGRVKIVAPEICDAMPTDVERVLEEYAPRHLQGASLVFAATDLADVNAAVVRDAHALGLLVNRADAAEEDAGDFSTPAVMREEDLIVTVSAGGSPTLAAAIRDEIKGQFDGRWAKMVRAMAELRPQVLSEYSNEDQRRAVLRDAATRQALEVLENQGDQGLWQWLRNRHVKQT